MTHSLQLVWRRLQMHQLLLIFANNTNRLSRPNVRYRGNKQLFRKKISTHLYTVWVKKYPLKLSDFFHFFHKRLRIFYRFFAHLLHVLICARLQIFMELFPTLTKLCHIKRDYLVHIICAKCPKRAKTHAFRRLCKSLLVDSFVDRCLWQVTIK